MASINKAILVGNLGRDPEAKVFGDRTKCTFSLATTESWMKDGEKQERTEWHNIVVWGRLGEICAQYLSKGRQVYVEGKITTRQYDDNDGNKKYITEINAFEVKFLGSGGAEKRANKEVAGEPIDNKDDIPF